jgi:hypothetical protein
VEGVDANLRVLDIGENQTGGLDARELGGASEQGRPYFVRTRSLARLSAIRLRSRNSVRR